MLGLIGMIPGRVGTSAGKGGRGTVATLAGEDSSECPLGSTDEPYLDSWCLTAGVHVMDTQRKSLSPMYRNSVCFCCLAWRDLSGVPQNASGGTNPSACEREIKKLGQPDGREIRVPWRTRYVSPAYPPIPDGTTVTMCDGEVLIDTRGRVSEVWTIREVKLTPPLLSLNKAITDAVAKWEFAPAALDNVPIAICRTVTVNVNLKAIRDGR